MGNRTHVPFDVFAMRVDVPVSTAVRDGDQGWTCGQCPLTDTGDVFAPGDLLAQTEFVCDMIESVLARAGFSPSCIGKLHVYLTAKTSAEAHRAEARIAGRFNHGPLIVVIPVPHFYYDGMLIEVDVFASTDLKVHTPYVADGVQLRVLEAASHVWAHVLFAPGATQSPGNSVASIARSMNRHGLDQDHLLSDLWMVGDDGSDCREIVAAVGDHQLMSNPDALVRLADPAPPAAAAILTFAKQPVRVRDFPDSIDGLQVSLRECGPMAWMTGTCADATLDLIGQTSAIMGALDSGLRSAGRDFRDVVKLTAHYTGAATEQELHGNMKVRHGFYSDPGPASTGVPVQGLGNDNCRISVDVLVMTDNAATAL